jgi:hypothetical protein
MNTKEYMKQWNKEHKEQVKEHQKRYKEKNKDKVRQWQKTWRDKHREQWREIQKRYRIQTNERRKELSKEYKYKIIEHYGQKCSCSCGCSETYIENLTIDHIQGLNGQKRLSGLEFYRWIIKNNYPKDLRILCWNCNCCRGLYGYCVREKKSVVQVSET